ncbi:MAG TPA: hypothetical protein VGH56_02180 [Solirubrobacteraceae bacterium]
MRATNLRTPRPVRYGDLLALAGAAPLLLLGGASPAGYAVGAATWLVIRALGLALDSTTAVDAGRNEQVALRLGYRLARIILLAVATIAVRDAVDKDAGITALAVIAAAFMIQLCGSLIYGGVRRRQTTDDSV